MPIALDSHGYLMPSCRLLPTLSKQDNVKRVEANHRDRLLSLQSVREPAIRALLDCQSDFDLLRISALTAGDAPMDGARFASYALELQRGVDEIRASFGCPHAAERLQSSDYSEVQCGPLHNRGVLDDLEHAMPFLSRTKVGLLRQNFPMQATANEWEELDRRRQSLHVRLLANRYLLLVRRLEIQADTESVLRFGQAAKPMAQLQREVDALDIATLSRHVTAARERTASAPMPLAVPSPIAASDALPTSAPTKARLRHTP